jgi:uncharacterized membrane protein
MKKILMASGLVGLAAAGVYYYMRNRNATANTMHRFADAAGDAHESVRKYFRKANHEAKRDFEDAIA